MTDEEPRTLRDDAHDVWRSLVLAFSPTRWTTLHDKYLRFRWLVMFAGFAAFMDGVTAFPPRTTDHVTESALGLWALGMAALWNPAGGYWWRDPDARSGGYDARPRRGLPAPAAGQPVASALGRALLGRAPKRFARGMVKVTSGEVFSGGLDLELPEFAAPPSDPLALLAGWVASAEGHGVVEPLALTLATVGADGAPSTRVVLV